MMMAPVAVPIIIGPAVIGIRPRAVIVVGRGAVVSVTRPIIIRPVRASDGSGGQCAGRQAERQSGAEASRLSRRGHRGCANGGNRCQDCQCLFHAHLLPSRLCELTQTILNGCSGTGFPEWSWGTGAEGLKRRLT